MPVTLKDIRIAANEVDLSYRPICVHSSLRSFGIVEGGASTVISGLKQVGCTILVPTCPPWDTYLVKPRPHQLLDQNGGSATAWQTYFDSLPDPEPDSIPVYDAKIAPVDKDMGAIPAAVVANPAHIRGQHPLFPFAALGPLAEKLIVMQTAVNVFAPLKQLAEDDGFVVLMGVDLTRATILHLAEELAGRTLFRRWVSNADGEPMAVAVGGCSEGFENLAPALHSIEQICYVGKSKWRLYSARQLLDQVIPIIQAEPRLTHCVDSACDRCNDALLGGPILHH
ncbi:MAG: AAC(3) family N-acetyltransferase [Chloroflexota bacterium]